MTASQSNKYNAKKTLIDGHTFDSTFESKVYGALKFYCGIERVTLQPKVKLFSKSTLYPNGKDWKVDFEINTNSDKLFVEAKGKVTLELYHQLTALEVMRKDAFNQFVLVFNKAESFEGMLINKLRANEVCFDRFVFPQVMDYAEFISILSRVA